MKLLALVKQVALDHLHTTPARPGSAPIPTLPAISLKNSVLFFKNKHFFLAANRLCSFSEEKTISSW